eukprot:1136674-Pelagomonas_calceolata.AAC.8
MLDFQTHGKAWSQPSSLHTFGPSSGGSGVEPVLMVTSIQATAHFTHAQKIKVLLTRELVSNVALLRYHFSLLQRNSNQGAWQALVDGEWDRARK